MTPESKDEGCTVSCYNNKSGHVRVMMGCLIKEYGYGDNVCLCRVIHYVCM